MHAPTGVAISFAWKGCGKPGTVKVLAAPILLPNVPKTTTTMDLITFEVILALIAFITIIIWVRHSKAHVSRLKEDYETALQNGNKREALEKGRAYYRSLRFFGRLTIYDEQAITNDVNAMN